MMSIEPGRIEAVSFADARPQPVVVTAVRTACHWLLTMESEFLESFGTALFRLAPRLAELEPERARALAEGLGRAVLWAALTDEPVEVVEATFQNIGADYARQGFPSDGYHGAGHALLRAARDTYTAEWTSELSSDWVAYFSWLMANLHYGSGFVAPQRAELSVENSTMRRPRPRPVAPRHSPDEDVPAPPGRPARTVENVSPRTGDGAPRTLDEVVKGLRARYFEGNDNALGAVLTRVALRTGADVRAPRADQFADPAVIAQILAVLAVMGYDLGPDRGDLQNVSRSDSLRRRHRAMPTGLR